MAPIARLALAAMVASGCGHANALPVDVAWTQADDVYAEWARAEAQPGGIAADVQFKHYGGAQGPVRVTAARVGDAIEVRIDYRSDRAKCVSVQAVHVVVHDVPAGARKLVVRSNGREVGTIEVTVPNGPASTAHAPVVAKLPGGGC